MKFKIIIVQPRYQINLGYIARVSKNFGIKRLFFVKPRTKIGQRAIMFSKHAHELLENAKIYPNLQSAISDCDVVVGTTGIWRKAKVSFKRIYLIEEMAKRISKLGPNKKVAILIGRDDIGLTKEEIERCDMVAYIGTNPDYPVLNISHALGILLYLLNSKGFKPVYDDTLSRKTDKKELDHLFRLFDKVTEKKRIRNKKAVRGVFRRLVYISQPNVQEVHALITALK